MNDDVDAPVRARPEACNPGVRVPVLLPSMRLDDPSLASGLLQGVRSGAFHPIRAEVRVGTARTRYLRLGSGPPLLALFGAAERDLWPDIVGLLSAHFKVIAPEPPEPPDRAETRDVDQRSLRVWTGAFLDGLGLQSTSVIASRDVGVAALWFALREPERVERLVLVHREGASPLGDDPALTDRLSRAGFPLLVVGVPEPAGAALLATALDPVVAFLSGAPLEAA